ncbi:MAG: hypothetical protein EOM23_09000, partial [Candidatus Moranbacteria bacterium]|nr:hypothetical protein [Candidatus Moranbacteria bacterium]
MRKSMALFIFLSLMLTTLMFSENGDRNLLGESSFAISTDGIKTAENELGNLISDIVRENTRVNAVFIPAGIFKSDLPQGYVYEDSLNQSITSHEKIAKCEISGSEIAKLLKISFSKSGTDYFLQQSGMRVFHDSGKILSLEILKNPENPAAGFETLVEEKNYLVAFA